MSKKRDDDWDDQENGNDENDENDENGDDDREDSINNDEDFLLRQELQKVKAQKLGVDIQPLISSLSSSFEDIDMDIDIEEVE